MVLVEPVETAKFIADDGLNTGINGTVLFATNSAVSD